MRFGKILEDLDALAGNIAFAHVQDPHTILVTASVDRIRIQHQDQRLPSVNVDQVLSGKVTFVGTSSMEIRMHCTDASTGQEWMEAYFTFVATNPETRRPEPIAPLLPETFAEHKEFEAGRHRSEVKRLARKKAKEGLFVDAAIEQAAQRLWREAGPLKNMPSLANPNCVLVTQTEMETVEVAQPQARNMASQIFGGFLMRRAWELAYSTAYCFGGERPIFYQVDQVQFSMPVNVGDMLHFQSRVLYAGLHQEEKEESIPLVSIEVEAWIVDPMAASAKLSNQFYFTFRMPGEKPLRKVLPSNMEEARAMALRMAAEEGQKK